MPLKTVLDSLDGVAAEFTALYVEKDGKFILDLEGIDEHPVIAQVKQTSSKRERMLREANDKIKKLEGQVAPEGFDRDEWERLKEAEEARQNDPDGKKGDERLEKQRQTFEKQREADRRKHAEELAERDARIASSDSELAGHLKDTALVAGLAKIGVRPGLIEAAKLVHAPSLEVVEDDGKRKVRVKDDLAPDVDTFLKSWADSDAGKEFIAPAKGGGAEGNHRQSNGGNKGDMGGNRSQRQAAIASKYNLPA